MRGKLQRQLLTTQQPSGLVAAVLFGKNRSDHQNVHRELLRGTRPGHRRVLAWGLLIWQWVRWRWRASHSIKRALELHGGVTEVERGVALEAQRSALHEMVKRFGIAPADYYRMQLFRPTQRERMWSYVYDCEAQAFHHGRNREGTLAGELTDKHMAAQRFARVGVGVAETLANLAQGSTWRDLPDRGETVLFCKPRSSSKAQGTFRVARSGDRLQVWRMDGTPIEEAEAADYVLGWFMKHDYLVQPYYPSHTALFPLGASEEEAVTLRLITDRSPTEGTVRSYCAYLEVPMRSVATEDAPARGYVHIEVDLVTGQLGQLAPLPYRFDKELVRGLMAQAAACVVPDWQQLKANAIRAHGEIIGRRAIAWDFVISPDGPVLLEGNANWSVTVPQLLRGPLLADEAMR